MWGAHPTTAATLYVVGEGVWSPPSGGPGPRKRGTPNGYRLHADHQIRVADVLPALADAGFWRAIVWEAAADPETEP